MTCAEQFDEVILPHLDAAYRLARWRLRNDPDAEDVVQEASLRAIRYFTTFRGGNARAWFLKIVRNICNDWRGGRVAPAMESFDEEQHGRTQASTNPEALLLRTDDIAFMDRAIRSLPDHLREVIVLRELEGLSYQELADVIDIPIGTVMSRLSRARRALSGALADRLVAV